MESVPPTVVKDAFGERIATHPAYGVVRKSVQSGHMHMFGSRLQNTAHFETVSLRFAPAMERLEAYGETGRFAEFYGKRDEGIPRTYLEVTMTAAQWVQLITGQSGDAVPVTLRQTATGFVPAIAEASQTPLKQQFDRVHAAGNALRATLMRTSTDVVQHLAEQLPESLSKKERTTILNALAGILSDKPVRESSDLEGFLSLVTEAADMALTDTIAEAEAQVGAIVLRAGLDAIAARRAEVPQVTESSHE